MVTFSLNLHDIYDRNGHGIKGCNIVFIQDFCEMTHDQQELNFWHIYASLDELF